MNGYHVITDVLTGEARLALATPALVYSECVLIESAARLSDICANSNVALLYSLKALCQSHAVGALAPSLAGFSVCSPFEARFANEKCEANLPLHITTPHFDAASFCEILSEGDYVTFNSIMQFRQNASQIAQEASIGLRVNPALSLVSDQRYDPCRQHSKLGVSIDELLLNWKQLQADGTTITGIHFHTNCEGRDFGQLLRTVTHIDERCGHLLDKVNWINLGGGYLFAPEDSFTAFYAAVSLLQNHHNLSVFIEPGTAFVREAGYLVSTVVDRFSRDGKEIAVLDTTVNHMPEVFEFQFEPDVLGSHEDGKHRYILAGCSCLAGDLFGEYGFDAPLSIGDRVVFANVGDYTTTKWHYFNGINLPSIYMLTEDGELVLVKEFTYEEFAERNGVSSNVVI